MEYLVVADDLTGANDTGAAFAARGHETVIDPGGSGGASLSDADVGVVNTDSRYSDPEVAAHRVRAAVERAPDARVYKKVDSTLRGNLVAEVDAAMDATGADLALVAPAFPATGRITVGGYHLVDGTPVAETAAGRDAKGPQRSHLPTLLTESAYPVVHLSLDEVAGNDGGEDDGGGDGGGRTGGGGDGSGDGGDVGLADAFADLGAAHDGVLVVPDATTDVHLAAVAGAAADAAVDVLSVGSAGLASHVRSGAATAVLGVVGSVAPETLVQLDALPAGRVVRLDAELVVADTDAAVDDAVDAVTDRLETEEWAVATAAREPADVEAALAAGRDAGLDEDAVRERVARALGEVALGASSETELTGLFATGGAVATATLDALAAERVGLTGHQVEPGVPLGRLEGGPADGLPCVTKAGAFGDESAIVTGLRFLAGYDG